MTLLLALSINPIYVTAGAIFLFVTLGMWFVLARVSGDDKPRAEARLDMMRKRRASQLTASGGDTASRKNEALTAYLEKAAT
ncbi:MAG: hypothetical protein KDB00_10770, partial [Planctomycetales bacterium]|nr:hypothetical protein [Planctomycetales bacterium]